MGLELLEGEITDSIDGSDTDSTPTSSNGDSSAGGCCCREDESAGNLASRDSCPVSKVPVLQPATRTAYNELARQRMERYMQEHAEQAALNTPQGLIPFARVSEIRE